jgi:surface polysaccharide O-acyltransferase-like enzyme
MVIAIFIFFKDFSCELNVSSKFINLCSRTTLGIYLIHPVFLKIFYGLKLQLISPTPWLNVPLTAVSIFLLSFILVFIFKKVPFLKKFL